jgi:hypothetical protein
MGRRQDSLRRGWAIAEWVREWIRTSDITLRMETRANFEQHVNFISFVLMLQGAEFVEMGGQSCRCPSL